MNRWMKSLIMFVIIMNLRADGHKDTRLQISELCIQPKQAENCGRSSSEYCSEDDGLDDKLLRYFQNPERIEYGTDEHKTQLSTILNELKFSLKKRSGPTNHVVCDCLMKYVLVDLGHFHFPRYLVSAVCQGEDEGRNNYNRCLRGSRCKNVEYKVKVLTRRHRGDLMDNDVTSAQLPDALRMHWKFKTVTVTAGCYCSQ